MTSDIAALTPAEIDTELARIWTERSRYLGWLASTERYSDKDAKRHGPSYWETINGKQAAKSIAEYKAKCAALQAEIEPYTDEYSRRGGWSRYFLVNNTNGHVHRSMSCTTCFPTTQYFWLPELSDCDEDAMIEEWGEMACTVCFPSAPTNPAFNRPSRRDREAQEARWTEKAARQAAKDAKAIADLDGSPLRIDGSIIKTKVAARNELSGAISNLAWYGPGHPSRFQEAIVKLVAVLRANAPEIDVDKVIANAKKRAAKDGAQHLPTVNFCLQEEKN